MIQKFTNVKSFRFSDQQMKAFEKLDSFDVDLSKFVRAAISEKIKRDYKKIKFDYESRINKLPF